MEKKVFRQRLRMMRTAMREMGIDYYLVPTADFHNSEYVSDYFKAREFLSGFTGSSGTLVISREEVGLWTDGRYFVQAQRELEDTEIRLFRMHEDGVPDIVTYLRGTMCDGQCLGFDGRTVDAKFGRRLEEALAEKRIRFVYERDVVDMIWQDRPAFPCSRAEVVPARYCGQSVEEKLACVREKMKEEKASCFFLSKLDDIMWLLNIRGSDVACNPVLLSYAFLTQREAWVFLQARSIQRETIESMYRAGVQIREYRSAAAFLREYLFGGGSGVYSGGYGAGANKGTLLYDGRHVSYAIYRICEEYGNCRDGVNPTEPLKAVKTETELAFIRKAYLQDSVAVTKFIYWVKRAVSGEADGQPAEELTEHSAAQYLESLRRAIPEFLGLSFPTISAYMENAAMMHYEAKEADCSRLEPEGLLLVDSGGQYLGGTTDVTRTIALGVVSEEMKVYFTAVATGMLRLAGAKFLHGCTGRNLDILARSPLWDMDTDYKCGTGHGVGYMLNVHEGPHSIRWRAAEGAPDAALEAGMLVTDEPGVYRKGRFGIRTENVLEVKKGVQSEDGQFLEFEHLTYVPIDLDAVAPEKMPERERAALNAYHKSVYEKISPYLTEAENEWLAQATREI